MFDWLNVKVLWLTLFLFLATLFGGCISPQGRTHGARVLTAVQHVGEDVVVIVDQGARGIVADGIHLATGKVLIP